MTERPPHETIRFDAVPQRIGERLILRLPDDASRKLPSRGQVAVRGTINGCPIVTVVEPDGDFGHWMRMDEKVAPSSTATVELAAVKDWPEPDVPPDLEAALRRAPDKVQDQWRDITPMARWEWVRWVNATRNPDTRRRRVEVSISKMNSGKRRPCCFNLAACTDPDLSRSGRLVAPDART